MDNTISFRTNNSPNVFAHYHESEIDLHTKIAKNCLWMGWASIIILGITIIVNLYVQSAALTVSAAVSGFIDLFSSISLALYTKSAQSKQTYYTDMSFNEEQGRLIELLEALEPEDRKEFITKLIDNYCDRRKK